MKIAAPDDVHGDLLALEAVLRDLQSEAPDLVLNLGDLVPGPFDPAGSADAQTELGCPNACWEPRAPASGRWDRSFGCVCAATPVARALGLAP